MKEGAVAEERLLLQPQEHLRHVDLVEDLHPGQTHLLQGQVRQVRQLGELPLSAPVIQGCQWGRALSFVDIERKVGPNQLRGPALGQSQGFVKFFLAFPQGSTAATLLPGTK